MGVDRVLPLITDPAPEVVMANLARSGAVLVRAENSSHEDFVALGDALMSPFSHEWPGGEREVITGDPTTTTVTAGTFGMPLHREAAYQPHSPSLVMFRCEKAATHGGQTLVCDGVALLQALPAPVRRFVTDREIFWETLLPEGEWQAAWQTSDRAEAARSVRDWGAGLLPWESVSARFAPAGMELTFGTICTPPALFDGAPAFCNSLLILTGSAAHDDYVDARLRARLADGAPFPEDTLAEVARVAAELTIEVQWRPGDILLVNNTRAMHGRRPFRGNDRRILVRMGHLQPTWLMAEGMERL